MAEETSKTSQSEINNEPEEIISFLSEDMFNDIFIDENKGKPQFVETNLKDGTNYQDIAIRLQHDANETLLVISQPLLVL